MTRTPAPATPEQDATFRRPFELNLPRFAAPRAPELQQPALDPRPLLVRVSPPTQVAPTTEDVHPTVVTAPVMPAAPAAAPAPIPSPVPAPMVSSTTTGRRDGVFGFAVGLGILVATLALILALATGATEESFPGGGGGHGGGGGQGGH